jgi:hypothetical protein
MQATMNEKGMLGRRTFTMADQIQFATFSGDHNPMHLDASFARRTQAGEPAVHGMHLLLWALDVLATVKGEQPALRRLGARFNRFVLVGELVALVPAKRNQVNARFDVALDLVVAGLTVAQITADYGAHVPAPEALFCNPISTPTEPRDLTFQQIEGLSGRLAFASTPESAAAMFPALSNWLGPRRLAALATTSLLVGMVCPGLHSIYGSLAVDICDEEGRENGLDFRVASTDPRFRLVRLAIVGGGLSGTLESLLRMPPVAQASSRELMALVEPCAFTGSTALVVGGSRGLGEVTAKLLAMGGANVVITYRVGRTEADAVVADIRVAGGICSALAYDAGKPAEPQLATLGEAPTHAYYFASHTIFRAQSTLFARARLDAFLDIYVDGFLDLAQVLRARRSDVSLFYPSSEFVLERPRGMVEYAMAKAAGEALCSEMNLTWRPLHVTVERLPRLLTDQTASVIGSRFQPLAECLVPVVRKVQSRLLQAA